jgi:hypothetical protein
MECLPEGYIKYVLSTEESARFRTRRISNCVWLDLGVSDNGTFDFERRLRGAAFPGIARGGQIWFTVTPYICPHYSSNTVILGVCYPPVSPRGVGFA